LKNLGTWCALAFLGISLSREFLDWVWWHNWGDQEEENPAPLLCAIGRVWCNLKDACWWLWSQSLGPLETRFERVRGRFFPPKLKPEPVDQDGRTPSEWLVILIFGVWEMERWYKDEYDWEVKRNWDEVSKFDLSTPNPESNGPSPADQAD